MATPVKNDNKRKGGMVSTPGAPAIAASTPAGAGAGAAKPRRLGRGLSSLINAPVVVSATSPAANGARANMSDANISSKNTEPVRPSTPRPHHIDTNIQSPSRTPGSVANGSGGVVELKRLSSNEQTERSSDQTAASHTTIRDQRVIHGGDAHSEHDAQHAAAGERLMDLDVSALRPSRYQPRKKFDEAALAELAASIRSAGVVQPIVVRPITGSMGTFEIIAGERRWRAAKLAGLTSVPARVCNVGEEKAAEWALIENLQRSDLGPMERAWALRGLCEKFGLTHAQAGERVGLDRSSVTNLVRLTELEPEIAEFLEHAQLSLGHGKALLGMTPGPARVSLAKKAAEESWSVRRLEGESAKRSQAIASGAQQTAIGAGGGGPTQDPRAASLLELEQQLSTHLGTRVRLRTSRDGSRGRLVLEFYDLDHFDGLMHKMGFVLRS